MSRGICCTVAFLFFMASAVEISASSHFPLDSKAATAVSSKLTATQKKDAKTIFGAAFDLYTAGEFDAAAIQFKKGLAADPGNYVGHYYLAETLSRLNDTDAARRHYAFTIELSPSSKEAALAESRKSKLERPHPGAVPGRLGITVSDLHSEEKNQRTVPYGVLVDAVQGAAAGVVQAGDIVLRINNLALTGAKLFAEVVDKLDLDRSVALVIRRAGDNHFVTFIPGTRAAPETPKLYFLHWFNNEGDAKDLKTKIAAFGLAADVKAVFTNEKGVVFHTTVGPYRSAEEVRGIQTRLLSGSGLSSSIMVREYTTEAFKRVLSGEQSP